MKDRLRAGFADRLSDAATAKKALVEKLRPRPTLVDPQHAERAGIRAAARSATREGHVAAKTERKQAAEARVLEDLEGARAAEEAALQLKRGERKERKALSAAEAKAKRDAKYAARQARR
jgi:hypothetical protein